MHKDFARHTKVVSGGAAGKASCIWLYASCVNFAWSLVGFQPVLLHDFTLYVCTTEILQGQPKFSAVNSCCSAGRDCEATSGSPSDKLRCLRHPDPHVVCCPPLVNCAALILGTLRDFFKAKFFVRRPTIPKHHLRIGQLSTLIYPDSVIWKHWSRCNVNVSFSNIPSSPHVWCEDFSIPYGLSSLVSYPPKLIFHVVSSIHRVSDTKPRSTHRADAQRLFFYVEMTIGLSLDIENALGDGPVALCQFSTLDVKFTSKIIVLRQQAEEHHCIICHPEHKLARLLFQNRHAPAICCRPADPKIRPTVVRAQPCPFNSLKALSNELELSNDISNASHFDRTIKRQTRKI
eukprot:6200579-Pleurochrysis_carterae.AAC.2